MSEIDKLLERDEDGTFHEQLSAHYQEAKDLGKLDMARIVERMPRKLQILKSKKKDVEQHELVLHMTDPKRNKIDVIAVVHNYSITREDGYVASGSEMLYFDADITTNSLKSLRDGLTKIIGDEAKIQSTSSTLSYGSTIHGTGGMKGYEVKGTGKNVLVNVWVEYENGQRSAALSGVNENELPHFMSKLREIAPIGKADFQGRVRKRYVVEDHRTNAHLYKFEF